MRRRSRFTKHRHVGAIPPERRAISPRSPSFAATISSPSALTAETNSSRNASIDAATWSSTVPLPFRVASTSSAAPRLAASSQCAECEKPRPPRHDDTRSPLDAGSTSLRYRAALQVETTARSVGASSSTIRWRDHELAGNYPAMTDIVKTELSRKLVELISLGLNVACANLNPEARAATLERRSRLEPLAIRSYSSSKPARLCRSMPWPRALPYWRKKPRQLG